MVREALEESRRITAEIMRKLPHANRNLVARIEAEGMEISYSKDADYLRITIGAPQESVAVSWKDQVYKVVYYDPDTYQIKAFESPFFLEQLGGEEPKQELWRFVLKLIEQGKTTVYILPRAERELAEQGLQDLIPV